MSSCHCGPRYEQCNIVKLNACMHALGTWVVLVTCARWCVRVPVDGDEPLMSGSGVVSKDVTDDDLLDSWHEALTKWHQQLKQKPKQVRFMQA